MAEIRRGQPEDFELVMVRVLASFREGNPAHLRFEDMYPDTVRPDEDAMRQWRLAFVDGELAAGMQVVPRIMRLAGCVELACAGLGNVFCYPSFRGQGLMSTLLNHCIADMDAEGFCVSMLGGDRARYGYFGWENAGAERRLSLSAHMTRHQENTPVAGIDLRPWTGDPEDTARMHAAYHRLPYHTKRTEEEFPRVLRRPGQAVWIADRPDWGFAYLSVRGRGTIAEYAGDLPALEAILSFLLRNGDWNVSLPPVEGGGIEDTLFLPRARLFQVQPTAMIRIVSLERTLTAYLPLLHERLRGWRGAFRLAGMEGDAVCIESTGDGIVVSALEAAAAADLCLDLRELARLLFGPFPPVLPEKFRHHPFLARAFPLPVYWHPLAHV